MDAVFRTWSLREAWIVLVVLFKSELGGHWSSATDVQCKTSWTGAPSKKPACHETGFRVRV